MKRGYGRRCASFRAAASRRSHDCFRRVRGDHTAFPTRWTMLYDIADAVLYPLIAGTLGLAPFCTITCFADCAACGRIPSAARVVDGIADRRGPMALARILQVIVSTGSTASTTSMCCEPNSPFLSIFAFTSFRALTRARRLGDRLPLAVMTMRRSIDFSRYDRASAICNSSRRFALTDRLFSLFSCAFRPRLPCGCLSA